MANPFTGSHPQQLSSERLWTSIFLLVPLFLGGMLLLVPIQYPLLLVIGAIGLVYLVLNPVHAFYLLIFTIPFTERIRVLPVSFSPNELVVLFCAVLMPIHYLLQDQKISLKTRLDGWILGLTLIFLLAGILSEYARGILGSLKFMEAVFTYYMTVYLIRSGQITRPRILKVLIFTALFQAGFGILQALTGSFGTNFQSNRGYLGYFGLGSSLVWHGRGTMYLFNELGNFLTTIFLIFLPLYAFCVKNKGWGKTVGLILLFAIIVTYSRGSLLGLIAGCLYFFTQVQPNRKKAILTAAGIVLAIAPIAYILSNSSYVDTLSFNDRLMIWEVPLTAITQSAKSLWLGSGLGSYEVVAWPYIPADIPLSEYEKWFAHNFYLLTVLELGLLGAALFFGFLIYVWFDTYKQFHIRQGGMKAYSLSMSGALIALFFVSIFDHAFASTYYKVFIFMMLGLLYSAPPKRTHEEI